MAVLAPPGDPYNGDGAQVYPSGQQGRPVPFLFYPSLSHPPTHLNAEATMRVVLPPPPDVLGAAEYAGAALESDPTGSSCQIDPLDDIHIGIGIAPPERGQDPSAFEQKGTSEEQWDRLRPAICRLYLDEAKSLEQVIGIVSAVYNFKAT